MTHETILFIVVFLVCGATGVRAQEYIEAVPVTTNSEVLVDGNLRPKILYNQASFSLIQLTGMPYLLQKSDYRLSVAQENGATYVDEARRISANSSEISTSQFQLVHPFKDFPQAARYDLKSFSRCDREKNSLLRVTSSNYTECATVTPKLCSALKADTGNANISARELNVQLSSCRTVISSLNLKQTFDVMKSDPSYKTANNENMARIKKIATNTFPDQPFTTSLGGAFDKDDSNQTSAILKNGSDNLPGTVAMISKLSWMARLCSGLEPRSQRVGTSDTSSGAQGLK